MAVGVNGKGVLAAIEVPRIELRQLELTLIGDSPLISHAWSQKAKQMMLDKQMKKPAQAKEAKDPFVDYVDSMYWLTPKPEKPTEQDVTEAKFGYPSVAFKSAAVSACRYADGIKMTEARGAFHINSDFVELIGRPEMREDMVRISMGTADIRYRAAFNTWKVVIPIVYNTAALSGAQIVNLFNLGGFGVGVGDWRPEKDGSFGRFHVAAEDEL